MANLRLGNDVVVPQRVDMLDIRALKAVSEELAAGKEIIAQAINNVGGEASADESLTELAQDIEQMPIVNVSAFKFSEVPNLAKQIAEQTYSGQLGEEFRTKITEINDISADITAVGSYAFQGCENLQEVNLPNVTSVGTYAFQDCNSLQEVNLPNVTSVGTYAFNACTNLQEINLPNITSVTNRVFFGCTNLQEVNLPNVTSVGTAGIGQCYNIKKLLLPNATLLGGPGSSMLGSGNYYIEEMHIGTNCNITYAWNYTNNRTYLPSLIKFVIGENWDINLNMYNVWTASTYLTSSAEQWANRLKLYENLRDYTISALYDHSADGVTRTFRLGFYATLYADSQLTTEPYGSYYTPLIKQAAQDCIRIIGEKHWAISA